MLAMNPFRAPDGEKLWTESRRGGALFPAEHASLIDD